MENTKCEKCKKYILGAEFESEGEVLCSSCFFMSDDELYDNEDRGGTGHGDISHSDADPGL